MQQISVEELNESFVDTIQRVKMCLLDKDDETIEYELFEVFDVNVISFLHKNSLDRLLKKGFINREIKELSLKLHFKAYNLLEIENQRLAEFVRANSEWREIFELADEIEKLKSAFDQITRLKYENNNSRRKRTGWNGFGESV